MTLSRIETEWLAACFYGRSRLMPPDVRVRLESFGFIDGRPQLTAAGTRWLDEWKNGSGGRRPRPRRVWDPTAHLDHPASRVPPGLGVVLRRLAGVAKERKTDARPATAMTTKLAICWPAVQLLRFSFLPGIVRCQAWEWRSRGSSTRHATATDTTLKASLAKAPAMTRRF